ncbi:MAG: hypothetical protein ACHQ4G_13555 [Opitutales bacterium]
MILLAPASVARAEHPMVAKARAYLGPETALNAVKTVHYTGSLMAPDPADPQKLAPVAVDIIFQAPYRQRTVRITDAFIDTTALDTYDGWHRVQDPKDAKRWRLQLLPTEQIKRQRAIAWENLAFFRGLEKAGGKVLDQGPVTIAGVVCRKLAFVHADDIIFYRYFDETTGRLVLTETESGSSIREQGEIMASGIRFPKMIVNTVKGADGKEQTVTITFDKIIVNEVFPDSTFEIPSFSDH